MTLRTRLLVLLGAFAIFALLAASATIYGVRLYVDDAIADFRSCMDQTREVDSLRLAARERMFWLREMVNGHGEPRESDLAERDAFFTRLEQVALWTPAARQARGEADWAEIAALTPKLKGEFEACLARVEAGDPTEAAGRLAALEGDLWRALETRLLNARNTLDAQRSSAINALVATNTQLLILAALVAAFGAGLVCVGAALIRRWLILPVAALKEATERLGHGELNYRVALESRDELADLGGSLNQMAGSLVAAQQKLHTSESKFRALFQNLRDAVFICDAEGRIMELYQGDLDLFGPRAEDWPGRPLSELWKRWRLTEPAWPALLERTLAQARPIVVMDLQLQHPSAAAPARVTRVDLVAYRVEYGRNRYAAIVLRDVTDRHELQRRSRQAETMKATISFAQGIAHDFNNLLTGGITTLTRLHGKLDDGPSREQASGALRACWQAARLARRLLDFAAQDRGRPQRLRLNEAVSVILNSLDEDFFSNIRLRTDCHSDVTAYVDRDQLTQVVLNLVHNAREAMPQGGELSITVDESIAPARQGLAQPRAFARLVVADTGMGMTEEVRQKLFEPFFSTKARTDGHRRGLGLAVVYAAVRSAGGLIDVESRPGEGSRFAILLPTEPVCVELDADRAHAGASRAPAAGAADPVRTSSDRDPDRDDEATL